MNNEELVLMYQREHDPAIIEQLWTQNQGIVRTTVFKMVSEWEIEDAIQEAAVALFAAVDAFQDDRKTKFSTFFLTVLRRHLIRIFWKAEDEPEVLSLEWEAPDQNDFSLEETIPDKNSSADQAFLDELSAAAILSAIREELSPVDADALILRANGHTFKEIKEKCGYRSDGIARSQLFQSRRKLQKSQRFMDSLPSSVYRGSISAFNRTWTSATEREALRRTPGGT